MIKLHNWGGDDDRVKVEDITSSATKYVLVPKSLKSDMTLLNICTWCRPRELSLDSESVSNVLDCDIVEKLITHPKQLTNEVLDPMVGDILTELTERFLNYD